MPRKNASKEKLTIGWTEHISFPEWGIEGIQAKVDTGARTSALHVEDIKTTSNGRIHFDVVLEHTKPSQVFSETAKPFLVVRVHTKISKRAKVKSSNGSFSERYFVKTLMKIGPLEKLIELSLVSRQEMAFRMLLGRTALAKDFIVDVSHKNLLDAK
jgi:hypothetical protein